MPTLPGVAGGASTCLGSTPQLGTQFWDGTCLVSADTSWQNGTLVLRGDLVVAAGVRLTLLNVSLLLDPAAEQQWSIQVQGGAFLMTGGTLGSNTSYHWRLVATGAAARVDLEGVNVTRAGADGGGPYSGFELDGGNGYRFERLNVTDSALDPDWNHAVFSIWSTGITDLRIEHSTFRGTGRIVQTVADTPATANIVFGNNVIADFNGTGGVGAIDAFNLDVVNNTIDTGANRAIWVDHGGGPGWPQTDYYHRISGNTVATRDDALVISGGSGYAVTDNTFRGRAVILASGNLFESNTIRDLDETLPLVTFNQNGTVRHNAWLNDTLHEQAALVGGGGYGNVSFVGNTLNLSCDGTNCMAIEVINLLGVDHPIFPGFPVATVAWNNITWLNPGLGTSSVSLDSEFSSRLYIHNNTQRVVSALSGGGAVTTAILAGGLRGSRVENNTMAGPLEFGIYNFIYEDAHNVFQFNRFDNVVYAGIFQSGGSVIRDNVVEHAANGWWICPNRPCAGSETNPSNLTFYNNTLGFWRGGGNVTRMTWPDYLNNTFLGEGPAWSNNSQAVEPVYGGWLFFANDTIQKVTWSNVSGARRVAIQVEGREYDAEDPSANTTGTAQVSVAGAISRQGSIGGRTLLRSLDPNGITQLAVTAPGPITLSIAGFLPGTRYRVLAWNPALSWWQSLLLTSDALGRGSVRLNVPPSVQLYILPFGCETSGLEECGDGPAVWGMASTGLPDLG